jgi:hypothetical protein
MLLQQLTHQFAASLFQLAFQVAVSHRICLGRVKVVQQLANQTVRANSLRSMPPQVSTTSQIIDTSRAEPTTAKLYRTNPFHAVVLSL